MNRTLLAGGDSFTFGSELSDDVNGSRPSQLTYAGLLSKKIGMDYKCVAVPGQGNSGIARNVFMNLDQDMSVIVMWTFTSRYEWAMPTQHLSLHEGRWADISPWDISERKSEIDKATTNHPEQREHLRRRDKWNNENGVRDLAESIYRYGSNRYYETYISWRDIIWLQNILKIRKIPYVFTLACNTLFYDNFTPLHKDDPLLTKLYNEIDFERWIFFGDRFMGFNQWAGLNNYERGSTHPLDEAHKDASKLFEEML